MNRQAKSAIKSLVLTLRHRLEEDIAIGLKRYGFAGERWLSIERLPHIEPDDAAAAELARVYRQYVPPLRAGSAETARLERRLAELVDAAYGLTPEEVALLWRTAPPRMPVGAGDERLA